MRLYKLRNATDNAGAPAEAAVAEGNENDLKQNTDAEVPAEKPADVPSGDTPNPPTGDEGNDTPEVPAGE